jgi:hypothetical protein
MITTAAEALRAAVLYADPERYRILHLPKNAITLAAAIVAEIGEPFAALLVDKDEVTLVITAGDHQEFATRLREARADEIVYRLITIDVETPPGIVGMMARLAAALAEAGIPIMPFAAFARDHILVPEARLEDALAALRQLQTTV